MSLELALLVATAVVFRAYGLTWFWPAAVPMIGLGLGLVAAWAYFVWVPGTRSADWVYAETFFLLALLVLFGQIAGPSQYAAAVLHRPLVDAALAAADQALGVDVHTWVLWTRQHPWVLQTVVAAYRTLLPQLFVPLLVLGFWYQDRTALWEYMCHFHVCSLGTVLCMALWPALAPGPFAGWDALLNQQRFVHHLADIRSGVLTLINPGDVEGLVSLPSFHTAGALMVTWAFRRRPRWLCVLVPLNLALIAATVLTGVHYLVDVLAAVALFGASLAIYHRTIRHQASESAGNVDPAAAVGVRTRGPVG